MKGFGFMSSTITIEEMLLDTRNKLVVDVRKKDDFDKETYPDAINIFWEDFMEHKDELPKDRPIYLLCYSGRNSEDIADILSEEGYEIYSVEGGYYSWLRIKLEMFMKDGEASDKLQRI